MSSWGCVPSDIGYLILDNLSEFVERARFSAVCKQWNIVLKEYEQITKNRRNVLPMFLVPSPNAPAECEPPRIYALSCSGKYYSNLQLPLPFSSTRYYGSSYGWIASMNIDYTFTLLYPFGREVLRIDLPALEDLDSDGHGIRLYKLVISPDSTPNNYTIVAIYEGMKELATIKSGENSWTFMPRHPNSVVPASLFNDIVFYQGAVYAVNKWSEIMKIDVQARPPTLKVIVELDQKAPMRKSKFSKTYMVESTSSDLFFIQRKCVTDYQDKGLTTIDFNVFKVIMQGEKAELIDQKVLKSLDGDTFFVGDNTSIAIRPKSGCVPNSIYFMDDFHDPGYYKPYGPVDVGFYKIEDGTIQRFYQTNPVHKENVARSIWLMPLKYH